MIITSSEKGQLIILTKIRKQLQVTARTRFSVRVREGEMILTSETHASALRPRV